MRAQQMPPPVGSECQNRQTSFNLPNTLAFLPTAYSFNTRRPIRQEPAQRHVQRMPAVQAAEIDVHPPAKLLQRLGEVRQLLQVPLAQRARLREQFPHLLQPLEQRHVLKRKLDLLRI